MMSNKATHASGASPDGAELRRRNVPGESNGSAAPTQAELDNKKSHKVPTGLELLGYRLADSISYSPSLNHQYYPPSTNTNSS